MTNIMGNLPSDRLMPDYPFCTVGIDFAGPFLITDRKGRGCKITKCYLCIFICFRYRCIHLEAEENSPPLCWRLGRINKIFPGSDGVPRVADVKTSNGMIRRAINRLCILPIHDASTA
ncbi:unnamed protein product [Parnassius mnemosyne]|uniref:DUF5641 domain-containing protein n=1 Tax=Parnassius mnemosyne TaxID=213953 RepID=A0AAV1LWT0_9NEOP